MTTCAGGAKTPELRTVLPSAKKHHEAKAALADERNGRMEDALKRWDYVFNYKLFR